MSVIFFLFQFFQLLYFFYIISNEVTSMFLQQLFLFSKTKKFCQCHFFLFFQWILHLHKTLPLSIRKRWFRHDTACTTSFNILVTMIGGWQFKTWFMKTSTTIARETQFKTLYFNLISQFILLNKGTGGHVYVSIRNEKENGKQTWHLPGMTQL